MTLTSRTEPLDMELSTQHEGAAATGKTAGAASFYPNFGFTELDGPGSGAGQRDIERALAG